MKPPARASLAGLDRAEPARQLAGHGPNLLPGTTLRTLWANIGGVLVERMFLMLLVAGGLYLALGDRAEAAFLLSSVFVVIGIRLAQERKTQRSLESLRKLSAPRALVILNGEGIRVPGRDVVVGDLLVLHEGDRIAADAALLDGYPDVNESLLTGGPISRSAIPRTMCKRLQSRCFCLSSQPEASWLKPHPRTELSATAGFRHETQLLR